MEQRASLPMVMVSLLSADRPYILSPECLLKGSTSISTDSILKGSDPAFSFTECLLVGRKSALCMEWWSVWSWQGNKELSHTLGLDRHQSEILWSDPARLSELSLTFCPSPWPRAKLSSLGIVTMDADAATAAAAIWWRSATVTLVSVITVVGDATAAELENEEELKRAATFW